MQPMKRVGLVSLGVAVAVLAAALHMGVANAALTCPGGQVPADNGICIGQPQDSSSPAPVATTSLDPLADNGKLVCISVPVLSNFLHKGDCTGNTVQVPSDQPGGPILFYLKMILALVNGLVGAIILLVFVIAGIQYITSAGDPTRVKAAKKRIIQAVTALVLYMLMFAILNFLIPGGILL